MLKYYILFRDISNICISIEKGVRDMKISTVITIVLYMLAVSLSFGANGDLGAGNGANGSETSPWLIEDFGDFDAFCNDSSKWASGIYTQLETDIDLAPALPGRQVYTHAPIAGDTIDDNYNTFDGTIYYGNFIGNKHTISNLKIEGKYYCGLFGAIGQANISNLTLEKSNIDGIENLGCLVGYSNHGQILNCHSSGNITGIKLVGGLIGNIDNSISETIDSSSSALVKGDYYTGGLAGNNRGLLNNCYTNALVSGFRDMTGGLAGCNIYGTIINCYSDSNVSGNDFTGGLVGFNAWDGTISNCYSTGNVSGSSYVGGIVGRNANEIINCYSISSVSGNYPIYGFAGENDGTISNCFWDTELSGQGLPGDNNFGALGLSTSDMHSTVTFIDAGWDMSDIDGDPADWKMLEDHYPLLAWEPISFITAPDTNGLNADQAITDLEALGLTVATEYIIDATIPVDQVISQSIPSGIIIYSDRSITLTISGGPGISVPDLNGKTPADAEVILLNAGLNLGGTFYEYSPLAENTIIYTTPESDTKVLPGSSIDIVISLGASDTIIGQGTENEPYRILSLENFNEFCDISNSSKYWSEDKHTILEVDLDLSGEGVYPDALIGKSYTNRYNGIFNGNDHTISNATIEGVSYLGLFSYISINGSISDLHTNNIIVTGVEFIGTLAGFNDGHINNCTSSCTINGNNNIGGITGYNRGSIEYCYSYNAIISKNNSVGGIAGNNRGNVEYCYCSGSIINENGSIGGIVGYNYGGNIHNCFSTCSLNGNNSIGGICGFNTGNISYCYSTGSITGNYNTGGAIGYQNSTSSVDNCFWDVNTSGIKDPEAGQVDTDGVIGKSTLEMQNIYTFLDSGWDFINETENGIDDIWKMGAYPEFAWLPEETYSIVPDIQGMTQQDAETTILANALTTGNVIFEYSDTVAERLIIRQQPAANVKLPVGAAVDYVVSLKLAGAGTENNPYLIHNYDEFSLFANETFYWESGVYTRLENNIDLTPNLEGRVTYSQAPIAGGSFDYEYNGTPYSGVFNGNGYTINGLTFEITDQLYIGLFGQLCSTATIHDLGVKNVNISLNGNNFSVGGICGENFGGQIINCYSTGTIDGNDYIDSVGGLCGRNEHSSIIKNCYSIYSITLNEEASNIGGLCGVNLHGIMQNCYSASSITAGENSCLIGGLCGSGDNAIINCFWDSDICDININTGGTPKNTTGMMNPATYAGWNDGSWTIDQGNDYPRLAWEQAPGDAITSAYPPASYSGSGTSDEPFVIKNSNDMLSLAERYQDWDKYFLLANDIDMSSMSNYTGPGYFSGTFDGQGNVIKNLKIDSNIYLDNDCIGLFPWLLNAEISNLGIIDAHIIAGNRESQWLYYPTRKVGILSGYSETSTITSCHSTGKMDFGDDIHYTGGLVGRNISSSISNCQSECEILLGNEASCIGGLIGENQSGAISSCQSKGLIRIISDGNGEYAGSTGGFCGSSSNGEITDCHSSCSIHINEHFEYGIEGFGGLLGQDFGSNISYCSASGQIIRNGYGCAYVGGFCGKASGPNHDEGQTVINNCYSSTSVTITEDGHRIGGFIGHNGGKIQNCYSNSSLYCLDAYSLGGFGGSNGGNGVISNCHTRSYIYTSDESSNTGGFLGNNDSEQTSGCFWDTETTGINNPEADIENTDGITGISSEDMKNISNFINTGWDFVNETNNGTEDIWRMEDYPVLNWQTNNGSTFDLKDFALLSQYWLMSDCDPEQNCSAGDFNKDRTVNLSDLTKLIDTWLYEESISNHISIIDIFTGYDYEEPDDPYDPTYDFEIMIATDDSIIGVDFITPAGNRYSIPNQIEFYHEDGNGWLEAGREYSEDDGWFEWYYEPSFYDESSLDDFGDGEYIINIQYANGTSDSTCVWFGIPGTNSYYQQPTQQPVLTNIEYGVPLTSPLLFTWEQYSGIPINHLWFDIENEDTGDETEFEVTTDSTGLNEPVVLESGEWEIDLGFANYHISQNDDNIEVVTGKYSEAEYYITVQ